MHKEQHDLAVHMLREFESPSKTLTSWEEKFLESINTQWQDREWLSERQMEILERIYAEKTA